MKTHSLILILPLVFILAACGSGQEGQMQTEESSESAQQEMTMSEDTAEMTGAQPPQEKVNINTAAEEVLLTIPAVGDRMAYEFDEYRPYTSILQFRQEIGKYVDEEQVTAYEQYIFVPISPNDSDAATLQQIPGLDADEVDEVIAARPFDSNDAFLQTISSFVSEDELTTAESYIATE